MRKPKPIEYVDPSPKAYSVSGPEAVATELTLLNQIRQDSQTIIWGLDDSLPLHILTAIAESPTTTSCISKMEMFTKGSGFQDEGLMTMPIDKNGTTLWDYHCGLVQYYVSLDGYTTNFKYNNGGKIDQAFVIPTDGCRLMAQQYDTEVTGLKYNPYFGTKDFQLQYTTEYTLFDPSKVKKEYGKAGTNYTGQAYFHGTKRTLYKHYPVPKYWSAKKWIYSDAKMATYSDKLLSNGFFQSALLKVIGDPNAMSKHPSAQRNVTGTDGVVRKESYKTNGQVFDEMMAKNFSGVEKTGTVMTFWSLNGDQSPQIEAFPNTVNFDQTNGTLLNAMRMISLATDIPGILVNIPDTSSPLSGQDALPNAIAFAQDATAPKRAQLENFYNTVLLPNFEGVKEGLKVKLKEYSPVKVAVTIDDKFWEFMNEDEKVDYITNNESSIKIIRPLIDSTQTPGQTPETLQAQAALRGSVGGVQGVLSIQAAVVAKTTTTESAMSILTIIYGFSDIEARKLLGQPMDENGMPVDPDPNIDKNGDIVPAPKVDDILRGLKVSEINRITSIVRKYETKKITIDQAKQLLAGYGLTEEQQLAWLNPNPDESA